MSEEIKKVAEVQEEKFVQRPKGKGPISEKEKKEAFRQYFIKVKRKLGIAPNLEGVIWMHLKAIGCDKPEDFEKGIENFGYKLKETK